MREIVFLNSNKDKWRQFESMLKKPDSVKPDTIADLFVQVTDDLSYARTFYPKSKITDYLNSLSLKAHYYIYQNKKEKASRILLFWKYEFPIAFRQNRRYFGYALIVFLLSVLLGAFSSAQDETFVRIILGDDYVDMTLYNIQSGDPMAVYKQSDQTSMFLQISLNNIRVAFLAFVAGVLFSGGTFYILFMNGVMLGSFQYFFYEYALLYESVLTIWIHGTIEIFVIIVAGGAGVVMGHSFMFPGTYKRLTSFRRGAKEGAKIVLGLVPFFLVAASLEGFVTRYTDAPDSIRLGVILASLTLIGWYFFWYPEQLYKKMESSTLLELQPENAQNSFSDDTTLQQN